MKLETNHVEQLDIRHFKREGLLNGHSNVKTTFRDGLIANLDIHANQECKCLDIEFLSEDVEEEKRLVRIQLDASCCYFGGLRYWFYCPNCNERIGILYKVNNEFACRKCHDLIYPSKSPDRNSRFYPALLESRLRNKLEDLKKSIKRMSYAGKPTKKWIRLDKLYEKYKVAKNNTDAILKISN